jgi:HlyD family secretion protein
VVLRLESRSQEAGLQLARQEEAAVRAERERACLAAERAKRELERFARLAESQIVSADLLDAAETAQLETQAACRAAAAQVARAAAAVVVARTELDKRLLRTPFSGIVAEVSTELGEWVTPSPPALPVPPVIDVLDPTSIYIGAPMDEVDSARIQVGQPARVTVDSHQGRTFAGRIVRIAPYVLDLEAQNRTVDIDVELEDQELAGEMLPGTSADVEVILSVREDVLRIPTSTLIEGQRVLVLADGKLAEHLVETGLRNWDFVEILAGLEAGDRVVTSLDRPEVRAGAEAAEEEGGE